MSAPNPLKEPELEFRALLFLVLAASALFLLILWPFFGAVCWAVFIAIKVINSLKEKKEEQKAAEAPAALSKQEMLLTEIRDLLKK